MAYTPPSPVNFNFLSTYTPATTPLTLNFAVAGELFPSSIDESEFGSATIYNTRQYLLADGFDDSSFGTLHAKLEARTISVGGIPIPPNTGPQAYRQLPSPVVEFRTKVVYPTGIASIAPPAPALTHYIQYITINPQPPFGFYGTPSVASRQFIEVPTIYSIRFGYPVLSRWQDIFVESVPLGYVGSHTVRDRRETLSPTAISPPTDAVPTTGVVANRTREIRFDGIVGVGRMFEPVVHNRTLEIYVSAQMGSDGDPTGWAPFPATVRNRNVELPMFGIGSPTFSVLGNQIRNVHLVVAPAGLTGEIGADTTATHKIRAVFPTPITTIEYTFSSTQVHNTARVISGAGAITFPVLGYEASVINRNRVLPIGPAPNGSIPSAEAFGTAFVAFAIRYLYPDVLHWGAEPIHDIRINPNPIRPISIPDPDDNATFALVGHPRVEERFNIIKPQPVNVSTNPLIGVLSVANRNRAVFVHPSGQVSEYGAPTIANIVRYIPPSGIPAIGFGVANVRDRRSTIYVFNPPRPEVAFIPSSLTVRNIDPDPPTTRYILCSSGTTPETRYGIGEVRTNTIYADGFSDLEFGTAVLSTNNIIPERGIFNLDQVGSPYINGDQFIYPEGAPWPRLSREDLTGSSDQHFSVPAISPYTIYAPSSDQATEQAIRNHEGSGELMDYIYHNGNFSLYIGRPEVSNWVRTITNVGVYWYQAPPSPGEPVVELRKRYIPIEGIRSLRFGNTEVGGGAQTIDMDEFGDGYFEELSGYHSVSRPAVAVVPFANPLGIPPIGMGEGVDVALKHRTIPLVGIPHRGNPQEDLTNPWGVAEVHYPVVHIYGVGHTVGWGTPRVEHRIRNLCTKGHDSSYVRGYSILAFADRMKVTRRNPRVLVTPISALSFGETAVTFRVREVYARSIAPITPEATTVSARATIAPTGWDSLVVGDIDRWEAGKIKPYGSELSIFGQTRVCWGIGPAGIADGTIGAHGTGYLITVSGLPPIGFDGPSVTDLYGCNNRVVVPLPVLPLPISTPTVGHV